MLLVAAFQTLGNTTQGAARTPSSAGFGVCIGSGSVSVGGIFFSFWVLLGLLFLLLCTLGDILTGYQM